MATVYLAVALGNSGFRKLAVVKVLRPEIAVDEEFVQMFLDEARLSARLSHPNIVHTYDVGVDDVGHMMAMEYLDGVSLHAATAKLSKEGGPLTFPLQARVLLDVIEGLRYAHELKDYDGRSLEIVHRDVTPHNIFVTYDGQVKLLDFGIAKAATSSVRTATGVIKGKLTYMAPEQARGEPVDARADLYAVGVMLWEAVTGRRRWPTGLSQPALFTRLARGELPESPNAAARGYPAEIDAVVLRALAPNPDDRYQTAAEFRVALEAALRGMAPVSLRDLGEMLANAYAEGRQSIRNVIEEQFRLIDSGGMPSAPNLLPAVSLPGLTASVAMEASKDVTGTSRKAAGPAPGSANPTESQSRRITTSPPPPQEKGGLAWAKGNSRYLILATGVLAAVGLVLAVNASSSHSTGAGSSPSVTAPPTPSATAVQTATQSPTKEPETSAAAPAGGVTQPTDSARRPDARNRAAPPVSPALGRGEQSVRTAPSATPPRGSASAAAESPSAEPAPVRPPERKPKVQLERDNPWP